MSQFCLSLPFSNYKALLYHRFIVILTLALSLPSSAVTLLIVEETVSYVPKPPTSAGGYHPAWLSL